MRDQRSLPIGVCLLAVLVAGCSQTQLTSTPAPTPASSSTSAPTQTPAPVVPTKTPLAAHRPLLMVHYMPWYQTPTVTGSWGWHWTMNHYSPDQKDANGRLAIASHYYPLTGPYDSSDDALLEYQVMLMKLSGIDGVIVDWYGSDNYLDYGMLNDATRKLFQVVKKAGLLFAICYEDTTIKNMVDNGRVSASDVFTHGQQVMRYLQTNWFHDEAYLKVSGRPVLLVFGNPPYFKASSDWQTLFSVLEPPPVLVTEDNPILPVASSSFPWPPMSLSGGGDLSQDSLGNYLTNFYQKAQSWNYHVASAFPGFHDIYKEAGVGNSYGYLDARNGDTFRFTLQAALKSQPDVIQLVTWNDYGEGTNIEPTVEYGYQYLQIVQDTRRASIDKGFPYTASDLAIPLQIFKLREQHKGEADLNSQLDKAVAAVLAGQLDAAKAALPR